MMLCPRARRRVAQLRQADGAAGRQQYRGRAHVPVRDTAIMQEAQRAQDAVRDVESVEFGQAVRVAGGVIGGRSERAILGCQIDAVRVAMSVVEAKYILMPEAL